MFLNFVVYDISLFYLSSNRSMTKVLLRVCIGNFYSENIEKYSARHFILTTFFTAVTPYWFFISALERSADRRKTFANGGNLNWLYRRGGGVWKKEGILRTVGFTFRHFLTNSHVRYNFTGWATSPRKKFPHCLQTVFAYSTLAFSFAASAYSPSPFSFRCHSTLLTLASVLL